MRKEILIDDKDIIQLESLNKKIGKSVSALIQLDSKLSGLKDKAFKDVVLGINSIGSEINSTVNKMKVLESTANSISIKIASSFSKISTAAKNIKISSFENSSSNSINSRKGGTSLSEEKERLILFEKQMKAELSAKENLEKLSSNKMSIDELNILEQNIKDQELLVQLAKEQYDIQTKTVASIQQENNLKSQNKNLSRIDNIKYNLSNAQTDGTYENTIAKSKEQISILTKIVSLKEKIGLANSEEVSQLNSLKVQYDQLNQAQINTAKASGFDEKSFKASEMAKISKQTQETAIQSELALSAEKKALIEAKIAVDQLNKATKEQILYKQKLAKAIEVNNGKFSDEEKAQLKTIMRANEKRQSLVNQISLELKLEQVESELAVVNQRLDNSTKMLKNSEYSSREEKKKLKNEIKELTNAQIKLQNAQKNITKEYGRGSSAGKTYYQTTGQVLQIFRELPNLAISTDLFVMSISNNLPMLIEGFSEAGREGMTFKQMLKSLWNPTAAISIAAVGLTMILMNYKAILKALIGTHVDYAQAMNDVAEGLKNGNSEAAKSIQTFELLKYNIHAANMGVIDGTKFLEDYNDKFGETYGIANNLAEAYNLLEKNSNKYYSAVIRHEIAMKIVKQVSDKMLEGIADELDANNAFMKLFKGENLGNKLNTVLEGLDEIQKFANKKAGDGGFSMLKDLETKTLLSSIGLEKLNKKLKELNPNSKGLEAYTMDMYGKVTKISDNAQKQLAKNKKNIPLFNFKISNKDISNLREILINDYQNKIAPLVDQIAEKYKPMIQAAYDIAATIDAQVPGEKDSSSAKNELSRATKIQVIRERLFRDLYTKEKQYNSERASLINENQRLETIMADASYTTQKNSLDKRLEAYSKYYKNKEKISSIDLLLTTANINEEAERQMLSLESNLKNAREQLLEDEAKLKEQEQKLASSEDTSKMKSYQEQMANLMKLTGQEAINAAPRINSLKEKMDKLSKSIEGNNSILEKNRKNVERTRINLSKLEIDLLQQKNTVELNAEKEKYNAIDSYTIELTKNKIEELNKYSEQYKEQLDEDLRKTQLNYDEQIKSLESYLRLKEQKQKDYGAGNGDVMAGIEALGTATSSYKRPELVDIINEHENLLESLKKEKSATEELYSSQDKLYSNLIKLLDTYATEHQYTMEEATSVSEQYANQETENYKKTLEDRLSYLKEERDSIIENARINVLSQKEILDATKNINSEIEDIEKNKEKKITEFRAKSASDALNILKQYVGKNLNLTKELSDKQLKAEEEKIAKMSDLQRKEYEAKLKNKEQLKQSIISSSGELIKNIVSLFDAIQQASFEYQQRALNNWYDNQSKMLEDQYKSQILTQKEYDAQKESLETEKRKKQHELDIREERYKRKKAIADIWIATATAIALAAVTAKGFTPLVIAYSAILTAMAGVQTATVNAQPMPAYKDGTDYHKGGKAIVGDGGVSELIETPSGELYKTPSTSTIVDLEKGSKVYPIFDKAFLKYNDRDVNVIVENREQNMLLKRTNKSLENISRNTRLSQRNYNRVWR